MSLTDYINDHHKTHIIFDFDATLSLLALPWDMWKVEFEKMLGNDNSHTWGEYLNKDITLAEAQNIYLRNGGETARQTLTQFNAQFEKTLLEGVSHNHALLQEVDELPDNLYLYIWSSNSTETLKNVLTDLAVHHKFEKIVSRDDVSLIKPDPAGFDLLYKKDVPKDRYLMVGDSDADRGAAQAAGINFYRIDYFA